MSKTGLVVVYRLQTVAHNKQERWALIASTSIHVIPPVTSAGQGTSDLIRIINGFCLLDVKCNLVSNVYPIPFISSSYPCIMPEWQLATPFKHLLTNALSNGYFPCTAMAVGNDESSPQFFGRQ